jgi:hypothetical protein
MSTDTTFMRARTNPGIDRPRRARRMVIAAGAATALAVPFVGSDRPPATATHPTHSSMATR